MHPLGGIFVVAIVFCVIVAPIWLVLHYGTRFRSTKLLTEESERALIELADLADRLTVRVDNLERLLEATAPEGRKQP
jgi:phage shock protein B